MIFTFFVNKARYMATLVPCGWQRPYLRSLDHLGRSSEVKDRRNPKKVECDGWTNKLTD